MIRFLAKAYWIQNLVAKFIRLIPSVAVHNIAKYWAMKKAFFMTALDGVEGDYLEFGVFTGSSFAAAIEISKENVIPRKTSCRFVGFDSFEGFGERSESDQAHPFFQDANFKTDFDSVNRRLSHMLSDKNRVQLVKGFYDQTLKGHKPADYGIGRAAVILVDCDTFSAAKCVFDFLPDALQEGTILLLDDLFGFKGSQSQGVNGAFKVFMDQNPQWSYRRIFDFGMGAAAYIICK